jgi:hypothetical protein
VDGPPLPVRSVVWSTVYQIPTAAGPVWFKASGGDTRYEPALAEALARWVPERVLTPLATRPERGWLLLPDGGSPLRDGEADRDHRAWERFVAGYAELQRTVDVHAGQLLAVGVPDHRPHAMVGHLAALLDDPEVTVAPRERAALRDLLPRFTAACQRLAASGPAPSVNHDDLHSGNVLPGQGTDMFFDWGDASIAHPFTSLLIALRTMAYTFGLAPGDPLLRRLRDAYLEPWGMGSDADDVADQAMWTGAVGRAMAWRRALAAATPAQRRELDDPVGRWLGLLRTTPWQP